MAKAQSQSGRLAALLPTEQRASIVDGLSSQLRREGSLDAPAAQLLADIVDEQDDPDAIVSLSEYVWTRLRDNAESESCSSEVAQFLASQPIIAKQLLSRLSSAQPSAENTLSARHGLLLLLRQPSTLAVVSQVDLNGLLTLLLDDDAVSRQVDADTRTSVLLSLLSLRNLDVQLQLVESRLASIGRYIWRRILILLTDKESKQRRYTGYLLWARWLDSPTDYGVKYQFTDDGYWSRIREGLQSDLPATQKICLHLLRQSKTVYSFMQTESDDLIAQTAPNNARLAEWDRYVAAFETIVIEQYPNQVQACLTSLPKSIFAEDHNDSVVGNSLAVDSSWWVALFASALSTSSLDSIRAIVGKWVLKQSLHSSKHDDRNNTHDCLDFLITGLLPWAFQGQLYSKSISRTGSSASSQHGENLSRFIHNFFSQCDSDDARDFYRLAILQWMQESWNKLNVHAAGYVLLGLASSVQPGCLASEATANLVTAFFRTSHRSEVQQQLIEPSCSILAGRSVLESNRDQETLEGPDQFGTSSNPSVRELLDQIDASNGQCFRGPRLRVFCHRLVESVRRTSDITSESDDPQWQSMLANLWEEIEIQDYPRSAVILLPSLLFHRYAPITSTDVEAELLSSVQITIMIKLLALSRGRIYIWTPLAKAVHGAFMQNHTFRRSPAIMSFLVDFLNGPPEAKPEFVLDIALAKATYQAYGTRSLTLDLDERQGHAHIFDMINALDCNESSAALQLLGTLMQPWLDQKPPVPMVSKWKRTTQIQAMIILIESLRSDQGLIAETRDRFMDVLALESLPRFRFLFEWIITTLTKCLVRAENEARSCRVLTQIGLQELNPTNPKYLASLLKIAIHIATSSGATEAYSEALFEHLVAMSASPKIIVRHEAQWQFLALYRYADRQGWAIVNNVYLRNLNRFIRSLEKAMVTPLARQLEAFDVDNDRNFDTLFEGGYLKIEPSEVALFSSNDYETVLSTTPTSQTSQVPRRILAFEHCASQSSSSEMPVRTAVVGSGQTALKLESQPTSANTDALSAFQTKAQSTQFLDIPAYLLDDAGSVSLRAAKPNSNEPQMILVASLVDSAYNLGGLSRAAEIFGCNELHVDNGGIVKDKAFTALSVSSENHIKIVETKAQPPNMNAGYNTSAPLSDMLRSKKGEGWTVVGIEQTSTSFVLGEYIPSKSDGRTETAPHEVTLGQTRLPHKVVFVLGAEKTGLPGWLLPWMDDCAEIRQHGVTRSLNVQTAAAILMWEWRRVYGSTK